MLDVTPALRAVTRRRLEVLARMDSLAAQRATLGRLLRRAAGTRFGRDHGFESISSVREYQARVKLRTYEDFQRDYFEPDFPVMRNTTWPGLITAYAQSSGTTGGITKRVPVSRAGMRSNSGASLDMLGFHLAARPKSRVAGGTNVLLGGSTSLDRLAPGVVAGDLSGIAAARLPLWARPLMFPPRELALIGDWESKMAAMAPASLELDVRSVSGTPSWMLLFFERVAAAAAGSSAAARRVLAELGAARARGGVADAVPGRDHGVARGEPCGDAGGLSGQRGVHRDGGPRTRRGNADGAGPRHLLRVRAAGGAGSARPGPALAGDGGGGRRVCDRAVDRFRAVVVRDRGHGEADRAGSAAAADYGADVVLPVGVRRACGGA